MARIILYHLIIVSLTLLPGVSVGLLLLVELAYMALICNNFFKLKYFISLHLFLGKVTQSFFLMIFHTVSFIIYVKNGPNSLVQPSLLLQQIAMWCLIISVGFEYLFLVFNIIWLIKNLCNQRK